MSQLLTSIPPFGDALQLAVHVAATRAGLGALKAELGAAWGGRVEAGEGAWRALSRDVQVSLCVWEFFCYVYTYGASQVQDRIGGGTGV